MRFLVVILVGIGLSTSPFFGVQHTRVRVQDPAISETQTRSEAQIDFMAERIVLALLGRPGKDLELDSLRSYMERGQTVVGIRRLLVIPDFQNRRRTLSDLGLLKEIYLNLLGRESDYSGQRAYLPLLRQNQVAEVMVEILSSAEMSDLLPQAAPPLTDIELCQGEIEQQIVNAESVSAVQFRTGESLFPGGSQHQVKGRGSINGESRFFSYQCDLSGGESPWKLAEARYRFGRDEDVSDQIIALCQNAVVDRIRSEQGDESEINFMSGLKNLSGTRVSGRGTRSSDGEKFSYQCDLRKNSLVEVRFRFGQS